MEEPDEEKMRRVRRIAINNEIPDLPISSVESDRPSTETTNAQPSLSPEEASHRAMQARMEAEQLKADRAPVSPEMMEEIIKWGFRDLNAVPTNPDIATAFQKILNEPTEFSSLESYSNFLKTYASAYLNSIPGADSEEGNGNVAFLARGMQDGVLDLEQRLMLDILLKRRALTAKFAEAMVNRMGMMNVWGDEKGYPLWPIDPTELGWEGYAFERLDDWDGEAFKKLIRDKGQKSKDGENLAWNKYLRYRERFLESGLFGTVMTTHSVQARMDYWSKPIEWLAAATLVGGSFDRHMLEMIGFHVHARERDIKQCIVGLPQLYPGSIRGQMVRAARVIPPDGVIKNVGDGTDTSWLTKSMMPNREKEPENPVPARLMAADPFPARRHYL